MLAPAAASTAANEAARVAANEVGRGRVGRGAAPGPHRREGIDLHARTPSSSGGAPGTFAPGALPVMSVLSGGSLFDAAYGRGGEDVMATTAHHRVLVIGGGTAGITVAARLRRAKQSGVAIIDPTEFHYYQPLWTLVGGGRAQAEQSRRTQADLIPRGVDWIRERAVAVDPDNKVVTTDAGSTYRYDVLVVCPGIQLDWNRVPGQADALGVNGVSSNYRYDLAPKTWDFIRATRSGTAVFTMPGGPIKCGGAPQKIAYLAADYWREEGVLDKIDIHLVVPSPKIFGVPAFAKELDRVIAKYGIHLHTECELTELDGGARRAIITDHGKGGEKFDLEYDVLHTVPHQSAPDWIKAGPLSTGDANGYVEIDKHSMQHVRYPDVFALGDAGSSPNSKTGAAVRKQAPVVVENIVAHLEGKPLTAEYHGYSSCPIVTARNRMLLCEFDYSMEPKPSIPLIDTTKERYDMWLLKKYGLPFLYWHFMLKGLA
jgi:sulfide:quinone oxidoreductase